MLTPLSSNSFKKMQLNAGLFIADFDYTEYDDADAARAAIKALISAGDDSLLGATRGGGTFSVSKETRSIEVDGKRNEFIGSTVIDKVDAQITGTLLEITPDNIARVMASGVVEDDDGGKKHVIKMRNDLKDEDYISKLCWVGEKIGGGLILISFDNALNNGDVEFTFTDKGEGQLPFEFHAYQEDVINDETAPFAVVLLD